MGADMIGYLAKGPYTITKAKRKAAARELLRLARIWLLENTYTCCTCGAVETDIEEAVKDHLDCQNCGVRYPVYLQDIKCLSHAEKKVAAWCDYWPPTWRDCARRPDPDDKKQVLVFAGDMSYGESPDGAGYEYLAELLNSGISDLLGIR
jgi:transcription elongation factor Elf1